MECFWRLFSHWQPDGRCYQQDPAIFYVRLYFNDGLSNYHLYGACFLEKYAKVYLGGEEKSLVLSLNKIRNWKISTLTFSDFYINSFNLLTTASTSSFVLCLLKENLTGTRLGLLLIALIT